MGAMRVSGCLADPKHRTAPHADQRMMFVTLSELGTLSLFRATPKKEKGKIIVWSGAQENVATWA
eukprot:6728421-Pyramimonas_sp.AAC.1